MLRDAGNRLRDDRAKEFEVKLIKDIEDLEEIKDSLALYCCDTSSKELRRNDVKS